MHSTYNVVDKFWTKVFVKRRMRFWKDPKQTFLFLIFGQQNLFGKKFLSFYTLFEQNWGRLHLNLLSYEYTWRTQVQIILFLGSIKSCGKQGWLTTNL